MVVRLGEWDTQHTTEFYPHEDYNVHKVVIHDGYNDQRRNLHNDMALLFLAENVQLKVCGLLSVSVHLRHDKTDKTRTMGTGPGDPEP